MGAVQLNDDDDDADESTALRFFVVQQELKINRPSKYPGPETPHLNWPDVLAR